MARAILKSESRKLKAVEQESDSCDPGVNIVVLRGILSSDPIERELPTGQRVTNLDVTTPLEVGRVSVPVVSNGKPLKCQAGDDIVIVGQVRRRFFRSGSGVQSRTEVTTASVYRSSQVARVRKAVNDAIQALEIDFL